MGNRDGLELAAESVVFFRCELHKTATSFLLLPAIYLLPTFHDIAIDLQLISIFYLTSDIIQRPGWSAILIYNLNAISGAHLVTAGFLGQRHLDLVLPG